MRKGDRVSAELERILQDGEGLVHERVRKATRRFEPVPDVGKAVRELRERLVKKAA